MKKSLLLFTITMLTVVQISEAQVHLGFSGQLGVPLNEFRDNTDAIGGGFRASLYVPFAPSVPVFFGIDFGYMVYGSNVQRINEQLRFVSSNGIPINNFPTIPINLRVTTKNNMINSYAVLRAKAPLTTVQPYIDALVGLNYLYTRTRILDETDNRILTDPDESNVISASTQINSLVFSYGGGAGVMINLGTNLKLDVRAIYLFGGEAEYFDSSQTQNWSLEFTGNGSFDPNNINSEDLNLNNPEGTPKRSRTDLLSINAGIVLSF